MKEKTILISSAGILFLALHVFGIFLPVEFFWGVDQWNYLHFSIILFLLVIGLLFCIYPSFKNLESGDIEINFFSRKKFYAIVPLVSMIPFWFLRVKVYFLGDGYLRLRELESGIIYRIQEPLETYTHSLFYNFLNRYFNVNVELSWILLSVLCGGLFVFIAMLIAEQMGKTNLQKVFILSGLLTMGTIQLFFGYIETYSMTAVLILTTFYFGLKSFDNNKFGYLSFATYAFAVCFHPSSIIFFPAMIYLYIMLLREKEYPEQKIIFTSLLIILCVLPVLITITIFYLGDLALRDLLAPFFGVSRKLPLLSKGLTDNIAYTIFSPDHIIDIFNEYLLIAPMFIFIIFYWLFNPKSIKNLFSYKFFNFLFLASISGLVFMSILNPEIGASRDWDLFSITAIPITLGSLFYIIQQFENKLKNVSIIIIGCCLLHTVPWILLNVNESDALNRFIKLAHSRTWSKFAQSYAYDELRHFYGKKKDFEKSLEWALKAYEVNKNNNRLAENVAAIYNNNGLDLIKEEKYTEAEQVLLNAYKYYPKGHAVLINLGTLYHGKKDPDKASYYFQKAATLYPNNISALKGLAVAMISQRNISRADSIINRVISTNTDENILFEFLLIQGILELVKRNRPFSELENSFIMLIDSRTKRLAEILASEHTHYAMELLNKKKYSDAETLLLYAQKFIPGNFTTNKNLGAFYYERKDYGKALNFYEKANEIQPGNNVILRALAMQSFLLGNKEDAIKYIDEALNTDIDEKLKDELLNIKKEIEKRKH